MSTDGSFNVRSENHKYNLIKGYSTLQQQQEFVDLTIAAGGYLVKTHQSVLALASPYIKSILLSTPCQHPVIFFSNIAHNILSYILEYVYTGEVQVPCKSYPSFIQAAREMHIEGLDMLDAVLVHKNIHNNENDAKVHMNNDRNSSDTINEQSSSKVIRSVESNEPIVENIEHENGFFENLYNDRCTDDITENNQESSPTKTTDLGFEDPRPDNETNQDSKSVNVCANFMVNSIEQPDTNLVNLNTRDGDSLHTETLMECKVEERPECKSQPLYTLSNRGSITMILNRYVYNMHYTSNNGSKRRWRCIDYRRKRCPAYVDTRDDIIITRKNFHSHEFHDNKIVLVGKKKNFYTSLSHMNTSNT